MCSLEELAPRQTHHRGLSMRSTSMEMSPSRSSPSIVLHCWLQWCTESHMNISPTWRVSVVFPRTTSQCRTTPHRCLFSRYRVQLPSNLATGHSQSWRATEKCMQQHWTAPNTRHEPHQVQWYSRHVTVPRHLHKAHGYDIPPLAWSTPSDEYDTSVSEAELQFSH